MSDAIELTIRIPEGVTCKAVKHYLAEHDDTTRADAYRAVVQSTLGAWVDVEITEPEPRREVSDQTRSAYELGQMRDAWRHRRLIGALWHAGAWLRYEIDAAVYRLRLELDMVIDRCQETSSDRHH